MKCNSVGWSALVLFFLVQNSFAATEKIQVPEDELATETVLPVFQKKNAVLNRHVVNDHGFEFGLGAGMNLNEPYYNQLNTNMLATYYFTNVHALNLFGTYYMQGLSGYGQQLKNGDGIAGGATNGFDPSKAPSPQWSLFANYQYTAYYGKISLTKQTVMNLSLFGYAGAGAFAVTSKTLPALDVGLGQNFYFSPDWGVRFDLKMVMYKGPDATSQSLRPVDNPPASSFTERFFFNTYLNGSLIYQF